MERNKTNTLTPEMQEVVGQFQEHPLKVISYVNVLDEAIGRSGLPKHYNQNYRQLEKFTRFLQQLEMEYVYYYDSLPANSYAYVNNPGVYGEELAKKMAASYNLDFDEVLDPEKIKRMVDLSAEENQYIRQIEACMPQISCTLLQRYPLSISKCFL